MLVAEVARLPGVRGRLATSATNERPPASAGRDPCTGPSAAAPCNRGRVRRARQQNTSAWRSPRNSKAGRAGITVGSRILNSALLAARRRGRRLRATRTAAAAHAQGQKQTDQGDGHDLHHEWSPFKGARVNRRPSTGDGRNAIGFVLLRFRRLVRGLVLVGHLVFVLHRRWRRRRYLRLRRRAAALAANHQAGDRACCQQSFHLWILSHVSRPLQTDELPQLDLVG